MCVTATIFIDDLLQLEADTRRGAVAIISPERCYVLLIIFEAAKHPDFTCLYLKQNHLMWTGGTVHAGACKLENCFQA